MSSGVNEFTSALEDMADTRADWNRRYLGNVGLLLLLRFQD